MIQSSDQMRDQTPTRLLLTHQQMADALGIGTTQLDALVAEGCPRLRTSARTVRYYPPDVLAWLRRTHAEGDVPGPAEVG